MWRHFRAAAEMAKNGGNLGHSIPKLRPEERPPLIGIAPEAIIPVANAAPGNRCARRRDVRSRLVSMGLRWVSHIYRMGLAKSIGCWARFYLGRLDLHGRTSHGVSVEPTRLLP